MIYPGAISYCLSLFFPPFLFCPSLWGWLDSFKHLCIHPKFGFWLIFSFGFVLISLPNLDTFCRWIFKKIIGLKCEQKIAAVWFWEKMRFGLPIYYANIFKIQHFIFEYQYSKFELFIYKFHSTVKCYHNGKVVCQYLQSSVIFWNLIFFLSKFKSSAINNLP